MVMVVVVQTEASGETVTLLQGLLLAQTVGFLQIVAQEPMETSDSQDKYW